jgi:hypothetical protein
VIENQGARLVAFVEARLDEDEATAKAASAGGAWRYEDGDSVGAWTLYDEHWTIADLKTYQYEEYDYAVRMPRARDPRYVDADANGAHIARHDPARVLREVEAKRAILGQYEAVCAEVREPKSADHLAHARSRQFQLEQVLPLLALPYADHPAYNPAWAPDVDR